MHTFITRFKQRHPMTNSSIVPWLLRASSSRNKMELFTTYSWSLVAADRLVCGSRVNNDTREWMTLPVQKSHHKKSWISIHELKKFTAEWMTEFTSLLSPTPHLSLTSSMNAVATETTDTPTKYWYNFKLWYFLGKCLKLGDNWMNIKVINI